MRGAAGAALALVLLLGGCAWISGPCELDYEQRRVACDAGGQLVVWRPNKAIEALGAAIPERRPRLPQSTP